MSEVTRAILSIFYIEKCGLPPIFVYKSKIAKKAI